NVRRRRWNRLAQQSRAHEDAAQRGAGVVELGAGGKNAAVRKNSPAWVVAIRDPCPGGRAWFREAIVISQEVVDERVLRAKKVEIIARSIENHARHERGRFGSHGRREL